MIAVYIPYFMFHLTSCFNHLLSDTKTLLDPLKTGVVSFLPKPHDGPGPQPPLAYRPITLIPILGRLLDSTMSFRVTSLWRRLPNHPS